MLQGIAQGTHTTIDVWSGEKENNIEGIGTVHVRTIVWGIRSGWSKFTVSALISNTNSKYKYKLEH